MPICRCKVLYIRSDSLYIRYDRPVVCPTGISDRYGCYRGKRSDNIVDFKGFKWLIQTTDYCPVDAYIGIRLNPEDIHIMHKSEYSGLYGDYSSYSAEYDEIADASEEEDDEE